MIKLVVTDIDGTLLPEGTNKMNPELYGTVRALREKDILFAAASGRQYASMFHVFEPVADNMIFIAENGSIVMCREHCMFSNLMDQALAEELVNGMRAWPEGYIVLSTPEKLCIETSDPEFLFLMRDSYHNRIEIVEDVFPYCSRTNKISLYMKEGIEEADRVLARRFQGRLNSAIAGKCWLDFMNLTVDKGSALAEIQRLMRIGIEETMAFGDNCNDLGMISRAGESYAVRNAHPLLKAAAKYEAPPNEEDGVLKVLRQRLLS